MKKKKSENKKNEFKNIYRYNIMKRSVYSLKPRLDPKKSFIDSEKTLVMSKESNDIHEQGKLILRINRDSKMKMKIDLEEQNVLKIHAELLMNCMKKMKNEI